MSTLKTARDALDVCIKTFVDQRGTAPVSAYNALALIDADLARVVEPVAVDSKDIAEALRRAYYLGQTYWRQADSDSAADHRRSDETSFQFTELVRKTTAIFATPQAAAQPSQAGDAS